MHCVRPRSALVLVVWALVATAASAHGLLVQLRSDGQSVSGTVYFSDGQPGAGEWVQMHDLTSPSAAVKSINAGPDGGFRFPASPGHRYRVSVSGDEGHTVDSEIVAEPAARGRFIERYTAVAATDGGPSLPPAWALIAGLLLLSAVPAWFLKRRRTGLPGPPMT